MFAKLCYDHYGTREPGHYEAAFYPTVQTTYNYRIFGNVSGLPLDLTFTCAPGGVAEGKALDNSTVQTKSQEKD